MVRNRGKSESETNKFDGEVDALFRLPLAEFTGARNTLAAQLKKSGRGDEAAIVKALAKPPISAWAVNQLYWNHRHVFDSLLSSGERFHRAQTSRSAGKLTEMRDALDARREALTELSDLATSLLREAGSNPALDTIRRITTTLEAMSAYASRSDAPRPGRLTHDVDPPGFESLASFVPGAVVRARKQESSPKTIAPVANTRSASAPVTGVRKLDETRNANIAVAKVSLQDAKRSLTEARTRARSAEASRNKASAVAKEAEKQKREAEERLERARAASQEAARRARTVAAEAEEATRALEYAKRAVKEATEKLEALFRESPRR